MLPISPVTAARITRSMKPSADGTNLVDDVVSVSLRSVILSFIFSERISVGQIVNGDSQKHVEQDI